MEILIFKPSKLLCVCWWLCDSYKRENTRHSLKLSVFDWNRIGASPSKSFAITLGDGTKWKTWSSEWVDGCMTGTREWKIGGSDLLERGGWVGSHRIWWQTIGSGSNEWELEKATWKPPKEEEDHLMSSDIIENYHELEGRGRRGLVVQCCRVSLQPWEAAVGKQQSAAWGGRRLQPPTAACFHHQRGKRRSSRRGEFNLQVMPCPPILRNVEQCAKLAVFQRPLCNFPPTKRRGH